MSLFQTSPSVKPAPPATIYRIKFTDIWPLITRLFREEKRDIAVVFVYGVVASILGLVVPLSSQAIVNAVALGVHSEQLVVLCVIVLLAMLAMAVVLIFQRHVIDYIQRRQFLTTAREMVLRLPQVQEAVYESVYAPELVNRFFDVVTVQKAISKFLLDGIAALLSLATGLIVLGLYHPYFLLYDLLFILFIPVLVFVFGRKAIATSVNESSKKYKTVEWIEEVARSHRSIKLGNGYDYAVARVDKLALEYAEAKEVHFQIFARQILGSYIFKAFAMVGILAVGGNLVIHQQLSLGQLVAAEILIVLMMGAMDKILTLFDIYYEFAAALTKIESVNDLPLEHSGSIEIRGGAGKRALELIDVRLRENADTISCTIIQGTQTAIMCTDPADAALLGKMMTGLQFPLHGRAEVFGLSTTSATISSLHRHAAYIDIDDVVHHGTIYDNIVMNRSITPEEIDRLLAITSLTDEIRALREGIHTTTDTLGRNLSDSIRLRIILARALAAKPMILVINGIIERLDRRLQEQLFTSLRTLNETAVVHVTRSAAIVQRSDYAIIIDNGAILSQGVPSELKVPEL
jgi:ABC-type bacteriocin/lantibiotic exporter with double-glycine peptidase domain